LVGSFQDITALKERELNLKASSILPCHLSVFNTTLEANTALHAAGIAERCNWKVLWIVIGGNIKRTQQQLQDNFYKVLQAKR
jgi:hypothetical protein